MTTRSSTPMATKPRESSTSSIIGKEKKVPSLRISPITTTTTTSTTNKRLLKPTTTTKISTPTKPTSSPSGKTIPSYLRPTLSSRLLETSQSMKPSKIDSPPAKPIVDRRRSLDTRQAQSAVTKFRENSHSRTLKALVSPGPRDRPQQPTRTHISNPFSKHGSERVSKSSTLKEGKTQQPLPRSGRKSNILPSSTVKKAPSTAATKGNIGKTKRVPLSVENESQVKEAINEQVVKVTEEEHEYDDHEHDHQIEESLIQPDGKVIIPMEDLVTMGEPQEMKIEEDENANQDQCNNIDESTHLETNHSTHEKEEEKVEIEENEEEKLEVIEEEEEEFEVKEEEVKKVEVKENEEDKVDVKQKEVEVKEDEEVDVKENVEIKEKEEQVEVKEKEEGVVVIEEDHKSEINNKEEKPVEENIGEKSEEVKLIQVEEEQHKDKHEEKQVVKEDKEESIVPTKQEVAPPVVEVQAEKKEPTLPIKQEASSSSLGKVQGKKESVSNDMIEETASKLLEARRNRVRALAGAFQTVIDHQKR